jgi:integrase/recombinase XerD
MKSLFKRAGIPGGHAHRFRDTFAVELLEAGTSTEDVRILLGHTSVKVTEKHYSPWIKTRQDRLEQHVMKTWSQTKKKSTAFTQLGIHAEDS